VLFVHEGIEDACASLAVAVGVMGVAHGLVGGLIQQQAVDFPHDGGAVCADQFYRAGSDGLGTFGGVAHDQYRLAQ